MLDSFPESTCRQAHARFKEEIYNIAGMVLMMHLQMSNYIIYGPIERR